MSAGITSEFPKTCQLGTQPGSGRPSAYVIGAHSVDNAIAFEEHPAIRAQRAAAPAQRPDVRNFGRPPAEGIGRRRAALLALPS